jgi:hypothetical protein
LPCLFLAVGFLPGLDRMSGEIQDLCNSATL